MILADRGYEFQDIQANWLQQRVPRRSGRWNFPVVALVFGTSITLGAIIGIAGSAVQKQELRLAQAGNDTTVRKIPQANTEIKGPNIEVALGIALPTTTSPRTRLEEWLRGFEGSATLLDCRNVQTPHQSGVAEGLLGFTNPDQGNNRHLPTLEVNAKLILGQGVPASSTLEVPYLLVTSIGRESNRYAVNPNSIDPPQQMYRGRGLELVLADAGNNVYMGLRGPIEKCLPALLRGRSR